MAVYAYVLLTVNSGSERKVCEKISEYDEVLEVKEIYGEYDIAIRVRAEDLSQLDDLITYKIRSNPNVLLTHTMIIAREHKRVKELGSIRKNEFAQENLR